VCEGIEDSKHLWRVKLKVHSRLASGSFMIDIISMLWKWESFSVWREYYMATLTPQ